MPLTYTEIFGQEDLVARLKNFGEFFTSKGSSPGHMLLTGEDGMGKATIAEVFACEMRLAFQKVDASELEIIGDLTVILTNLRHNQVLLLSNIHLLRKNILSILRNALRDNRLPILIGQGTSAIKHTMDVTPFTLIATCPRKSDCPAELLSAFALVLTVNAYSEAALQVILRAIGDRSGVHIEDGAAELIVRSSSEPRPRCLESTLHKLTRAINKKTLSADDVHQALLAFGIDIRPNVAGFAVSNFEHISGVEFEKLVVTILEKMGFRAEMTKASGDGGIDIDAVLAKPIVGGRYLFQCKRFASDNLVGAPTLRDFYGAVTAERAVKGVFITTSDFTPQAREFGQKAGLELVNRTRLQELLVEFGLELG